jgi:hypothetical protein
MKDKLFPGVVSIAIFLLVLSCSLFAQKAQTDPKKMVVPPIPIGRPWDLAVVGIVIKPNCLAEVVVKNTGTVALPDWVYGTYSSGKYVLLHAGKEGSSSSGIYLFALDPAKVLKTPGGQLTYAFASTNDQPCVLWGHIDPLNQLPEANEANNKLTKRVDFCPFLFPDLQVADIRLVNGCEIEVTLSNTGGGVPDSYYDLPNAVAVQMYVGRQPWGGMILKMFDPTRMLKNPNSSVKHIWFPNAGNLLPVGWNSIRVVVDAGNVLSESNENNNSLTKKVNCMP